MIVLSNPSSVVNRILRALLFAASISAEAAQPAKMPRIGFLSSNAVPTAWKEAFRQGLRDLGYVEGKNIVIEYRSAEGKPDRLPALAAELVRLKVDVIVTLGSDITRTAKQTTVTIPIVMAQDSNPVGNGFVSGLARPGGNITGLANLAPELSGKRLELLKDAVPKLSRVAIFTSATSTDDAQVLKEIELAAGPLGVNLRYLYIRSPNDFGTAFRAAVNEKAEAALVRVSGFLVNPERKQLVALAVKSRLPVMYERADEVDAGGLMSYGVSIPDLYRRAATYVDKILKGAKPADLPVEQPKKFEFIINLKAAKQIGLTIPPSVLARADRVVK
jgi:putative ABC transport system substrate-binding protein